MNRSEHLLTILSEECAEIAFEASNAIEFGLGGVEEGKDRTYVELLGYELVDLRSVIELLEEERVFPFKISDRVPAASRQSVVRSARSDLLTLMVRSCAQVSKRVAKALRFGLAEVEPGQCLSNVERIADELIQLAAVSEALEHHGVARIAQVQSDQIAAKKAKVRRYMQYAVQCGTLIDPESIAVADAITTGAVASARCACRPALRGDSAGTCVPSSATHALLNIMLCQDTSRAIADAREFLISKQLLDRSGEPTAKAWAAK